VGLFFHSANKYTSITSSKNVPRLFPEPSLSSSSFFYTSIFWNVLKRPLSTFSLSYWQKQSDLRHLTSSARASENTCEEVTSHLMSVANYYPYGPGF